MAFSVTMTVIVTVGKEGLGPLISLAVNSRQWVCKNPQHIKYNIVLREILKALCVAA